MTVILIRLVAAVLRFFEFLMFARAIFSWFPQARSSKISDFLYSVTEPLIMPFRALFDRFSSMRMMPIDLPFFCTFLVILLLEEILYAF